MRSNQLKPRQILPVLLALLASLVFLPAAARAHAFLDHSEPKVGSEVAKAPTEVRIKFTQAVEPAFSKGPIVLKIHGGPLPCGGVCVNFSKENL